MNKLEGKKQKAIARELNISIHTVQSQMVIAYKKLKVFLKKHILPFLFFFIWFFWILFSEYSIPIRHY